MSQYGYGYGPPPDWQPPHPYSHPPPPSYGVPAYQSTERPYAEYAGHGNFAMEPFEYNRQTIPGLGLNFSDGATHWQQQPWMNEVLPFPPRPLPPAQEEPPINTRSHVGPEPPLQSEPKANRRDEDALEEGELSEGELEDIYDPNPREPRNAHDADSGPPKIGSREVVSQPRLEEPVGKQPVSRPKWEPPARERSGSYSPYLSPREIHSSGQEGSASIAIDTPSSEHINRNMAENGAAQDIANANGVDDSPPLSGSASSAVAEARRKAEEAIRHLWSLHIRHQNYLDEGIDKDLLDNLFTELGLDPAAGKILPEKPVSLIPETNTRNDGSQTDVAKAALPEVQKPQEAIPHKSEERKDRIARLLAAKSSKAAAPAAPIAPVAPVAPPVPTPSTNRPVPAPPTSLSPAIPSTTLPSISKPTTETQGLTKSQSEKSRLIQQKMEALKKQREATKTLQQPSSTPAIDSTLPHPLKAAVPETNLEPKSDLPAAPVQPPTVEPSAVVEVADSNGSAIPGLFLSSTPQPLPATNDRKRPVAADLNEYSDSNAHKRPFGQNRQSQPFLIDVSDDEHDTEMDLDSADEVSTPIYRPSTPVRTTSFRDYPALSDNVPTRQMSSPKTLGTPTGIGNGVDLESMNKKIEDMKRKIAEAEARKKAKLSSNGTPISQSQDQSKEGSADTTSAVPPDAENARSASVASQPASPAPLRLPKQRGEGRERRTPLRARIASERLPILEAHRKEQLHKLEQLQSEVAKVEREIQDGLKEEQRLREEAECSESDQAAQDCSESETGSGKSQHQSDSTAELVHELDDHTPEGPRPNLVEPQPEPSSTIPSAEDGAGQSKPSPPVTSLGAEDEPVKILNAPPEYKTSGEDHVVNGTEGDLHRDIQTDVVPQTASLVNEAVSGNVGQVSKGVKGVNSVDSDSDSDVAMDEADNSSSAQDEESLDDYEPTEAGVELANYEAPETLASSKPTSHDEDMVIDTSDDDLQGVSATSPVLEPISTVQGNSQAPSESSREVDATPEQTDGSADVSVSKSSFVPYETPLHYFHAYRFHPEFKRSVAGGYRSLTYSNKIDAQREVCPDELLTGICPRGGQCEFQHIETMKSPDDQILLQLGADGNCDEGQKQEYISGLRKLLTDFRNRKVKDFQVISDGIIEYRAKFNGDKTRILPLGNVSL